MKHAKTMAGLMAMLFLCFSHAGCERKAPPKAETRPILPIPVIPITNMVIIGPGSFIRMNHRITLTHSFWIGKFEITQREFTELMGRNPSHFPGNPDCPVEKVSYVDAMAYCAVLTARERQAGNIPSFYEYRLPSEAEWEYACRAGTTNKFSFGDKSSDGAEYAWTSENSQEKPHPVGQKLPNPRGLHDMHGNVWEWTLDWFVKYPEADLVDPIGPREGKFKVFRGGGWNNDIEFARSANRFMMEPSKGIHFVGFRIVMAKIPASKDTSR